MVNLSDPDSIKRGGYVSNNKVVLNQKVQNRMIKVLSNNGMLEDQRRKIEEFERKKAEEDRRRRFEEEEELRRFEQ